MARPRKLAVTDATGDSSIEEVWPETPPARIDMRLPVKLAFLHSSVSIPAALNTEKTLNQTKFPGIELFYGPDGLWIHYKKQVAIVPHANVAIAVLK